MAQPDSPQLNEQSPSGHVQMLAHSRIMLLPELLLLLLPLESPPEMVGDS